MDEELEAAKKEVAKDLVLDLKETSPKRSGGYSKGWRIKKVRGTLIIHNATDYQLTHLLEKGHAKIGGGRVPAKIHIEPAEEKAVRDFLNRIERAIES